MINGGGTLLVNGTNSGTSAVTVGTSVTVTGILGGTGSIAGPVTVNAGSILSPGTNGTVGTLHTGALTLASGANFNADLFSTGSYDQLISTGAVNLTGATLNVNGLTGGTFALGNTLALIQGSVALTGTFSNAAQGATVATFDGFNFTADYTTNPNGFDLDVTAVPEPSTWVGGFLGFGLLAYQLLRRVGSAKAAA